jgi:hypothetical protein
MSSLNDKLIQSTNEMFYDCLTQSKYDGPINYDGPIPKLNVLDKISNLFNYIISSCIKRREKDANAIDANDIKHENKIVKDYEGNILEYISFP